MECIRKIAAGKIAQPTRIHLPDGPHRMKRKEQNAHIISDETTNLYALAFN
jgi:hypothetical protein